MCLSTIKGIPSVQEGVGYKVFDKDDSYHLSFRHYNPVEGGRAKYDYWYRDKAEGRIEASFSSFSGTYPKGFHIYKDVPGIDTVYSDIRKVSYKGAHTEGTQNGSHVVVAKEMLIHRKKDS